MTLAAVPESDLRMELWLSFIGVLKAYAALANLEAESLETANLDDTPCGIMWSAPSRDGRRRCSLAVSYDAKQGKGRWQLHNGDADLVSRKHDSMSFRDFALNADGSVSLDGAILDMDHAAIDMLGWLASTIKTGQIEVPA